MILVGLVSNPSASAWAGPWSGDRDIFLPSPAAEALRASLSADEAATAKADYEQYRQEHRSLIAAQRLAFAWLDHMQTLGEYPSDDSLLGSQLSQHFREIELHRELLTRELTTRHLNALRAVAPHAVESLNRLERDLLRQSFVSSDVRGVAGEPIINLRSLLRQRLQDAAETDIERVQATIDAYELALDGPLRHLDETLIRRRYERTTLSQLLRRARNEASASPDMLEPLVQHFVESDMAFTRCREIVRTALASLRSTLDHETFATLHDRVEMQLSPLLDADEDQQGRLKVSLETQFDRAATRFASHPTRASEIDRLRDRYLAARRRALATLVPLYEATLSRASREAFWRTWALRAARRAEENLAQNPDHDSTWAAALAEAEASLAEHTGPFEAKHAEWRATARVIEHELQASLGDDSHPDAHHLADDDAGNHAEIPPAPADDVIIDPPASSPLHTTEGHFLPLLSDRQLTSFLASAPTEATPGNAQAVRRCYDAYRQALYAGRTAFDERMADVAKAEAAFARESPGIDPWMTEANDFGAFAAMATWLRERWQLDDALERDISNLLPASQRDTWERHVRGCRRTQLLARIRWENPARLSLDLTPLVDALPLNASETDAWQTFRETYERDLDQYLRSYRLRSIAVTEALRRNATTSSSQQSPLDNSEQQKALDDWTELGSGVPALNRRAIEGIRSLLTPAHREAFDEALRQQAYPDIYAPSPVEEACKRLLGTLPSVAAPPPAMQTAIDAITDVSNRYTAEERHLQRRLVEALTLWESPTNQAKLQKAHDEARARGDDPYAVNLDNPIIPLLEARLTHLSQTRRTLRQIIADYALPVDATVRLLLTTREDMSGTTP